MLTLFYYHNFSEFIKITLDEDVFQWERELDISSLFSLINTIYPDDRQKINIVDVTFEWYGKADSVYELTYSQNEDLSECTIVPINNEIAIASPLKTNHYYFFLWGFIIFGHKTRSEYLIRILAIIIILLLTSSACRNSDDVVSAEEPVLFSRTISGLETDINYFWKIKASTGNSGFNSETIARSFIINGGG